MPKKLEEIVRGIVSEIIEKMGYELVDIEYNQRKNEQSELIIYIDNEDGISLDDTEAVSRAIDEPMDTADPIEEPYVMCVSSPGLDRPLKTARDFEKYMGRRVDVKLYSKLDGKKEIVGELMGYTGDTVMVSTDEKELTLEMKSVAQIRLHIDF